MAKVEELSRVNEVQKLRPGVVSNPADRRGRTCHSCGGSGRMCCGSWAAVVAAGHVKTHEMDERGNVIEAAILWPMEPRIEIAYCPFCGQQFCE